MRTNLISLGISIMGAISFCACSSDEPTVDPRPETSDWNNAEKSITLNDETLERASALFSATSNPDSLIITLSGVNPNENIEIGVTTTTLDNGDIQFQGEQYVKKIRQLKVDGIYSPNGAETGISFDSGTIKINVDYKILDNNLISRSFGIPFEGSSGFYYNADRGSYPNSKVDVEAQRDSCRHISSRINAELCKILESITFSPESDGLMTVSYKTVDLVEHSQTFRYWLSPIQYKDQQIFNLENAEEFHKFILMAIGNNEEKATEVIQSMPNPDIAKVYIDLDNYNNKVLVAIAIWDDLHYKIFPFLRDVLSAKGAFSDQDKDYFHIMVKSTTSVYRGPESNVGFYNYRWAFASVPPWYHSN